MNQGRAPGDPYAILGLAPGTPMAEVKRAYRRLAKVHHPDSAGEAAVPRFLAIQAAYEAIRTGKPMATSRSGPGGRAAGKPGEPWRADPERARAAREQARRGSSTRARAGGGPTASGGRSQASDSGRRAGGAAPGAASSGTSGGSRSGGRRNVRKATLGSTSYDDARDPNDATWSGASWYGPSTGEYWIVNPREYADPRKHGPEYQSRARRTGSAQEPAPDPAVEAGPAPAPAAGPAAAGAAAGQGPEVASTDGAAWSFDGDAASPPTTSSGRAGSDVRRDRPRREPWSAGPAAADQAGPIADHDDRPWSSARPTGARAARPSRPGLRGSSAADWLGGSKDDPIRRLGLALISWPPLGLAAAAAIGDLTGCATYSAACGPAEPLLPWLAQAALLGLLLLLPLLARILAGGTVAVVVALAPATALLVAAGGTGAPQAGPALWVLLAVAWATGVGITAWRLLRPGRAEALG